MRTRWIWLVALLALGACAADRPSTRTEEAPPRVDPKLVPNLHRVSEHVWSSGLPEGEAAFRQLAALGIRTVVSVDGLRPQLEAARRAGLRYVHIPFGYAGVPPERALEIAKAVRELEGPVLFHCHHGTQRGPAAAAIAGEARDGLTTAQALAFLQLAGSDTRYRGLRESVARFHAPDAATTAALRCVLPEVAPLGSTVDFMVDADDRLDRIAKGHPHENDYAQEALLLREAFVELGRATASRPTPWRERLDGVVAAVTALEAEATKGRPGAAAVEAVRSSCNRCHEVYRDNLH